jgi:hypothetical protein
MLTQNKEICQVFPKVFPRDSPMESKRFHHIAIENAKHIVLMPQSTSHDWGINLHPYA